MESAYLILLRVVILLIVSLSGTARHGTARHDFTARRAARTEYQYVPPSCQIVPDESCQIVPPSYVESCRSINQLICIR